MKFIITLADKCKESILNEDFDEIHDAPVKTDAIDDAIRRRHLEAMRREGYIESFFESQPMTMEA